MTDTKCIEKCEIIVLLVISSMFELVGFILFDICMKASSWILVGIDNDHGFVMTITLVSILIVVTISVGIILYVINHSCDSVLPSIMILRMSSEHIPVLAHRCRTGTTSHWTMPTPYARPAAFRC